MKSSEEMRHSRTSLEAELKSLGCKVRGNSVTCPAHEDKHASASLYESDGVWRVKCHVPTCGFCGDIFDVLEQKTGRDRKQHIAEANGDGERDRERAPKPKRVFGSIDEVLKSVGSLGTIEAHYLYCDPSTGAPQILQVRYREGDSKRFLVHHAVAGGFVLGAPPKPWPIYNRARLTDAKAIVVVEGEKCVHALHKLGIVATTSLSGAANADKADWSPLAGKRVYVWPDNDEPGVKYAQEVIRQLDALRPQPEVYLLPVSTLGLCDGGDAVDLIGEDGTAEEVWQVIKDASEPAGAISDLLSRIEDIIAGRWKSLELPWQTLSRVSKPLFPGTTTVICGDPSASKSIFVLEVLRFLRKQGTSTEILELEEDRKFHLMRLLAMLAGTWDVLDDAWGRANAEQLRFLYEQNAKEIADLSPAIHSAPLGRLRYAEVLAWIEGRCRHGVEVVIIDPITAVYTGESRHIDDLDFIIRSSAILREHRARMILVTHPRVGVGIRKTNGQDDMAGGRAFSRHTQTVLWLNRHDPAKQFQCSAMAMPISCNRSVKIAKSRNAVGHGWKIGFNLTSAVQFTEHGVVQSEVGA